jgi:hypothetical protein
MRSEAGWSTSGADAMIKADGTVRKTVARLIAPH